jgi:hypothetical protein
MIRRISCPLSLFSLGVMGEGFLQLFRMARACFFQHQIAIDIINDCIFTGKTNQD